MRGAGEKNFDWHAMCHEEFRSASSLYDGKARSNDRLRNLQIGSPFSFRQLLLNVIDFNEFVLRTVEGLFELEVLIFGVTCISSVDSIHKN